MRFAVKSTLALVGSYLLLLGGLAWWMDRELRALASSLMADAARLVGDEIGTAMSVWGAPKSWMSMRAGVLNIVSMTSARPIWISTCARAQSIACNCTRTPVRCW